MLRAEDLHVAYGGVAAVRGLSLAVPTGQIVALLGTNGAGKSTTLQAMCGLVPISAGRVTFDGRDLGHLRAHQIVRCGLALVPERRELFPELSVAQNLQLGSYTRADRAAIRD